MKTKKNKISYEPEADVLSLEVSKQPIDFAEEVGNFVVHFNIKNKPVLIEVLEASKFLKQAKNIMLSKNSSNFAFLKRKDFSLA
ncbi:MAG: DUF2283 domain-containing protein [Patescibacteria group bacterium]